MAHTVSVGEFEGPLGILLELVERNKLEVTAISVAKITAKYLERVKALKDQSAEQISEFLQLGARLVYIKSLALLPHESTNEQDQELRQLNLELEEYRRYQSAARQLGRLAATPSWERQVAQQLQPHELPLPNIALSQLTEAFNRTIRSHEPAPPTEIIHRHLNQEKIMLNLRKALATGFDLQTILDTCHDRLEVIVTFLALLELVREGAASVMQTGQFDVIRVQPVHV